MTPTETPGLLPPQHWAEGTEFPIEDDTDSTLEDTESSTASITSSILKYRTILGRRFHSEIGEAHYWGSNDEKQNEAADINHHVQTLGLDGKLFLAPLEKEKIKKVVDIGTGTGIWAIDFADEVPRGFSYRNGYFADSTKLDTAKSSITSNLIMNGEIEHAVLTIFVLSQIDDCTREWTFAPESLDYIHIRFLGGCIADWTALFKEAYKCLKPGGIIESMQPSTNIESDDNTVEDNSAMGQWGKIFVEGGRKTGRSCTVVLDNIQNEALKEAGFTDLHEHKYKSPIGSWPKNEKLREIGQYAQLSMETDIEDLIVFMTNVLGNWTREDIQVYIARLRREMRSGKKHGWYWQKIVWAKKPE